MIWLLDVVERHPESPGRVLEFHALLLESFRIKLPTYSPETGSPAVRGLVLLVRRFSKNFEQTFVTVDPAAVIGWTGAFAGGAARILFPGRRR